MKEENKTAEIEPKKQKSEIEVNDLEEDLSEDRMEAVQGGRVPGDVRSKAAGRIR
ncbi:hypothetical protein ACFPPD_05560 [Cohnella suwonensis]|uniref:Uncharacterized protein n=1 Tax=Cohnella suwonensis TaxID=696072 RepID=A0ABW0LQK9_9BACL